MSRPRHVLLVCTDHWPASLFGHRGHPTVLTPTLDQLARAGTVFSRGYSECPVCIPARRTLMTGTSPRFHGDRVMRDGQDLPAVPTLAACFRAAGHQAVAVGKLHTWPQRNRIGFDEVILSEEGRTQWGVTDDYENWLAEQGHPGAAFHHGMGNNQYHAAPWHLDDRLHVTNWATSEMCRQIKRRDPTRPGFWYLSYVHPHPPLAPLRSYLDLYRDCVEPEPLLGDWAAAGEALPWALRGRRHDGDEQYNGRRAGVLARQAFYALCTHIDHQLRLVIGTLREEGLLQDTVLCFTADHGDLLGDHGLWAKRLFYERSANVPLLLVAPGDERVAARAVDERLVGLQDVMPTLLELAGVPVPAHVEGCSMVGERRRDHLYGECGEGEGCTRMLHDGRHKLIWYPAGNRRQLFDLAEDPRECRDLGASPTHAAILVDLERRLAGELYGGDEAWADGSRLVGTPERGWQPGRADAGLNGQRGHHFPCPPTSRS